MIVWRLADPRYARDLSGEGSRLMGGRWNAPGHAVLYVSSHLSLAVLETLAHLPEYHWLEQHVPAERIALRLNNLLHKIAVVKAGCGIAPLLCFLAEQEPELARLTEPNPLFDTDIWLLSHPDLRQVARIRAFTDLIARRVAADPLLQGKLAQ